MRIFNRLSIPIVFLGVLLSYLNPYLSILIAYPIVLSLLRRFKILKDFDEFQLKMESEGYFYGFIVFFIMAILFFMEGKMNRDQIMSILLFPLLVKALTLALSTMDRRKGILSISWAMCLILITFSLLSHGFTVEGIIEILPPIFLVILSYIAIRFRFVGLVHFGIGVYLMNLYLSRMKGYGMFITMILLVLPIFSIGILSLREEE